MPRKSRQKKESHKNHSDEEWQQAWNKPEAIGMQKKQLLLNSINDRIDNRRRGKKRLLFIALSAAAAILIAVFIKIPGNKQHVAAATWHELASTDNSKKIMLEDGTVVWLAPYSSLKVYGDFLKQRSTVLSKGTAFFSVAKDAQHPFTIDINRQRITVIGTAFTVRKLDTVDLQLTVKEGKVALNNPGGNQLLTAGQQIITSKSITGLVQTIDPASADWWLQQQIRLKNISLKELLDRIETYYQVKLTQGNINSKIKVTLTWDMNLSLKENLTVLNSLTGYNIH
jgi:transmembrane sensor